MGIVRIFAFALLVTLAGVASASRSLQSVGYRQIEMPYPDGYVATSAYYPDIVRTFATRMPAQLQLLEVYVTQADFAKLQANERPAFQRMVQLHVMRAAEDRAVSADGFDRMTKELEASLLKTATGDLVGAPRRDANGLYYAVNAGPSYVGNLVINANFQPLNLIAYVPAGESTTAESTLSRWAAAIKAENPETGEFRDRAGNIDISAITGASGRTEDQAPYKVGYWLGIALFLYIVWRLFRRKNA